MLLQKCFERVVPVSFLLRIKRGHLSYTTDLRHLSNIRFQFILRTLFILASLIHWTGCSSEVFVNSLESEAQFERFAGPPLTDKYHEIKAVKVVYDIQHNKIYYLNHSRYKLHFDFCNDLKGQILDAYQFNKLNYSNSKFREFLLGNINFMKSTGEYFLELSPTDKMVDSSIIEFRQKVIESSYLGNELKFFLNNADHLTKSQLRQDIPCVTPRDIYDQISFQPIYKSSSVGDLRFVDTDSIEFMRFSKTDILVLNHSPTHLPDVSGVIVSEIQAPLSHLTILGQNRKIPISAMKRAFKDEYLRRFQNRKVQYRVLNDSLQVVRTNAEYTKAIKLPKLKLRADTSIKHLIDAELLNSKSRKYVGNKAANFGMLQKLGSKRNFKTPEGAFAVPFYYYAQHAKMCGAQDLIDSLANGLRSDREITLKQIRERILAKPIEKDLLVMIRSKMIRDSLYHRMRFRSSTNAEDEVGFSGAGLYESKTGILNHPKKSVSRAIKKVWASLWSLSAFTERQIFNIHQSTVYMGILAHRSFPNEVLNGVAITKNLYREENGGYVVNVQLGEHSVVEPDAGEVSDQFICFPEMNSYYGLYENDVVDIITTSSYGSGKLLMSNAEISLLANELYAIKRYFSTRTLLSSSNLGVGFDVEFKLYGLNRQLYIKQVRLYND